MPAFWAQREAIICAEGQYLTKCSVNWWRSGLDADWNVEFTLFGVSTQKGNPGSWRKGLYRKIGLWHSRQCEERMCLGLNTAKIPPLLSAATEAEWEREKSRAKDRKKEGLRHRSLVSVFGWSGAGWVVLAGNIFATKTPIEKGGGSAEYQNKVTWWQAQ